MERIPDVLLGDGSGSRAEEKVFRCLAEVDLGSDWVVYHSQNLHRHAVKRWCEIDFLLLGPQGAFVLEVKGGRIACKDGVWYSQDGKDEVHRLKESPRTQAMTARYALEKELANLAGPAVDGLVFGFGVVFPDVDWTLELLGLPKEMVGDHTSVSEPGPLTRYLEGLIKYWRDREKPEDQERKVATVAELNILQSKIRPYVDVYPKMKVQVGTAIGELNSLTKEQYERLSIIEANQRVIVSGGAGTGKTYLLMACAMRESMLYPDKSVLIVVESPIMASYIGKLMSGHSNVRVSSYRELGTPKEKVDVLMVDEGQDLLSDEILRKLSDCVVGDLDKGRWRWFMDENNQAGISGFFDQEALQSLVDFGPSRVPLKRNVRNTKQVAAAVYAWTGALIGKSEVEGQGRECRIEKVEGNGQAIERLEQELTSLTEEGIVPDLIGIILPKGGDSEVFSGLAESWRRRLLPLDSQTVCSDSIGKITWGTVDDFKGLERPIIFCIGFDDKQFADERVNELYVAMTRANWGCYLYVSPELAKALDENKTKNSKGDSEGRKEESA